ncbi:MAG: hypothetical protein IPK22_21180 [Verrucomicrobiaceae bacterium]|nr:hypothetical protein [Verrucomicrobiaceae bacterium]
MIERLQLQSRTLKPLASVVECSGKPWRDTAAACRTAFSPHSKAVSSMQGALASLPPH